MAGELELNDSRVLFMADYVLKTLKLKPDKFMKMYNIEENKQIFMDFFEKPDIFALLLIASSSGSLNVQIDWPKSPKNKTCYFVKKSRDSIAKDNIRNQLLYGDMSQTPLDQLSAFVDEVLVPLLSNDRNHDHWPKVVSQDVRRHVHQLKSNVYVVAGQSKGKTLLPLPVGTDRVEEIEEDERVEEIEEIERVEEIEEDERWVVVHEEIEEDERWVVVHEEIEEDERWVVVHEEIEEDERWVVVHEEIEEDERWVVVHEEIEEDERWVVVHEEIEEDERWVVVHEEIEEDERWVVVHEEIEEDERWVVVHEEIEEDERWVVVHEEIEEDERWVVVHEEIEEDERNDTYDRSLVHAIETVIIEWTHQIRDVLKRDSAQPVLEGLNPTPFVEINFWENKTQNLECIYEQLRDPKVRKMAELLEKTNSSYFPAFKNIFRDVVAALQESRDINMYLKPLRHHFEDLEQAEFDECIPSLGPMFHSVCLVWANSSFYNTPARIIVLLQEMCNMVMEMARNFLAPDELFKGEMEETLDKVRKAALVLKAFKQKFEDHRHKLPTYFKDGQDPRLWEFAPDLVFARYDQFVHRVETVKSLMETALEFMKLEKVELGGVQGKTLSAQVIGIFEEFQECYKVFAEGTYDSLDPAQFEFLDVYDNFQEKIGDIDRRMATIICQGFDDCSGLDSTFKLIDIMGSLLERPFIKKDFKPKYPEVVRRLHEDLDEAKALYDQQVALKKARGWAPVHKNMAKVSGSLRWAKEMRERITIPMDNFKMLDHPITQSPDAQQLNTKYEQMMALLTQWDREIFDEWMKGVDEACSFNLSQPLLSRNSDTNLITVNFDPQVSHSPHFTSPGPSS
ncbi:hypothetical protein ACOMHN_054362 [Nucella lapillus]